MIETNDDGMSLDDLRCYVLSHREDEHRAFCTYDRSKTSGRMITLDLNSNSWEKIERQIQKTLLNENDPNRF